MKQNDKRELVAVMVACSVGRGLTSLLAFIFILYFDNKIVLVKFTNFKRTIRIHFLTNMSCGVSAVKVDTVKVDTFEVDALEMTTFDLSAIEDAIERQMLLTTQLVMNRTKKAKTESKRSSDPLVFAVASTASVSASVSASGTSSMNLRDQTKRIVKKRKLTCAPTLEDRALISSLDALCSH